MKNDLLVSRKSFLMFVELTLWLWLETICPQWPHKTFHGRSSTRPGVADPEYEQIGEWRCKRKDLPYTNHWNLSYSAIGLGRRCIEEWIFVSPKNKILSDYCCWMIVCLESLLSCSYHDPQLFLFWSSFYSWIIVSVRFFVPWPWTFSRLVWFPLINN